MADNPVSEVHCKKCNCNNIKWRCKSCEAYDLCNSCHQEANHPHQMDQILFLSREGVRFERIQPFNQSLTHACHCQNPDCRRPSCPLMKSVVQHLKNCKKKVDAACPGCRQIIALCIYHGRFCTRDSCPVPLCESIRKKFVFVENGMASTDDGNAEIDIDGLKIYQSDFNLDNLVMGNSKSAK